MYRQARKACGKSREDKADILRYQSAFRECRRGAAYFKERESEYIRRTFSEQPVSHTANCREEYYEGADIEC